MPTIQVSRILCPVDFSDPSRHALQHAAAWARWFGSSLSLVHVYGVPVLPPSLYTELPMTSDFGTRLRAHAAEALDRFGASVESSGLPLERLVAEGDVVRQILAQARDLPADLLVMGTHGRGGFERWVLGSVTEKVIRKARCPVLTVPAPLPAAAPVAYRRILCPLDFSPSARRALDYGLALAQEADAEITLLHVIEWGPDDPGAADTADRLAEHRLRLMREAQEALRAAVPADARQWCRPQEIVAAGRPYHEILRIAEEGQIDLIVMGCQGRGALNLALFGSTTQQVLRGALCPVLSLRASGTGAA